jgi:SAM-dependent methyltransferase
LEITTNPWDEIFKQNGRVFNNPHSEMPHLIKLMKGRGTNNVLDLGNGTGRHIVYLAKNGFTVFGLDSSPEAIHATQKWLSEEGLTADLKLGNMTEKLPYKDSFFDAVITIKVINHGDSATVHKIAQEITRILKQGGLLFVAVTTSNKMAKRWEQIEPNTFIPLDGREKGLVHHFFTAEELREMFSGFNIVDTHVDKTKHYCLTAFKK